MREPWQRALESPGEWDFLPTGFSEGSSMTETGVCATGTGVGCKDGGSAAAILPTLLFPRSRGGAGEVEGRNRPVEGRNRPGKG